VVDAHIHLSFLKDRLPDMLDAARAGGVSRWLAASVSAADWEETLTLCRSLPGALPACGMHPWFITPADAEAPLPELPDDCAAIGEIGLDSHCPTAPELQRAVFRRMLGLARRHDLPVVIHACTPWPELFEELERLPVRGMVHGFTGSCEIGEQLIKHGLYVSLGPALTASPGYRLAIAAEHLPLSHLLVESDAPDADGAGRPPESVLLVPAALSAIRGIPAAELRQLTAHNFDTMLRGG
jgi:TatD DNase family protein